MYFFGSITSDAQEIHKINQGKIFKVSSINWKSIDLNEFNRAFSEFKQNDILILAESDHGHGSSMEAQASILKSLIDSSKIHSLYLESNWMNCKKIMEILKSKGKSGIKESMDYIQTYELKYWAKIGFWEYLAQKIIDNKLIIKGFDISGLSPLIGKELYNEAMNINSVKNYIKLNQKSYVDIKWFFEGIEGVSKFSVIYEKNYLSLAGFIDEVIRHYSTKNNSTRIKEWKSILSWIYWMYKRSDVLKENKYVNQIKTDKQFSAFYSIRDSIMADLFLESYKEDSNKKIACSMASYHAMRNGYKVTNLENCCKEDGILTMAEIVDLNLPGKIYSICFVSSSGFFGIDDIGNGVVTKIKKPKKGSIEYMLNRSGYEYCYLKLSEIDYSFYMNVVFNRFLKSKWHNNFSGVFFIKQMKPLILK